MTQNILITGASSGIGKAIALAYAKKDINLFLFGRNIANLEDTANEAKLLGANCYIFQADVTDKNSMSNHISFICKKYDLDLVFANAGISGGTSGSFESEEQVRKIFDTNISGVLNTIYPTIEFMSKAGKGHIVIISSLASFLPLSSCPAYSASKACVRFLGESLKASLKGHNIDFTIVTPGYIKTPMTDVNKFYMPFLMTSEKAAKIIKNKLINKPARIAFPKLFYYFIILFSYVPINILLKLLSKLPKKSEIEK